VIISNLYLMTLKKLLLLLFLCFGVSTVFAQTIKYRSVNNEDLVYVLNNIEKKIEFINSDQAIANQPMSAFQDRTLSASPRIPLSATVL